MIPQFLDNKYTKWYYSIIENAKLRDKNLANEVHHIIPCSLNGNNNEENLVGLTFKEHFICHLLLVKITTGKDKEKMLYAIRFMLKQDKYNRKLTSRLYQNIKEEFHLILKNRIGKNNPMYGKRHSLETRQLQSNSAKGKNTGKLIGDKNPSKRPEVREKISKSLTGRVITPETKEKLRQHNLGKTMSYETKKKHSMNNLKEGNPMFGRKHSEESKKKMSEKKKGKPSPHIGRKHSEETKQKLKERWKIRKLLNAAN